MNTESVTTQHHGHHDVGPKVIFGFWTFVLSDAVLFAILFAAYAVLYKNTFGAIDIKHIATLPYTLVQTLVLLASNLTFGLSSAAFNKPSKGGAMFWLFVTFVLGGVFIFMGWHELSYLFNSGNTWHKSAFLSAFFTLIGFQWFHVIAGLFWMIIMMIQMTMLGTTKFMRIRMTCLGIFWHFLNIVWLFIFAIVYLMGAL